MKSISFKSIIILAIIITISKFISQQDSKNVFNDTLAYINQKNYEIVDEASILNNQPQIKNQIPKIYMQNNKKDLKFKKIRIKHSTIYDIKEYRDNFLLVLTAKKIVLVNLKNKKLIKQRKDDKL